MHNLTVTISGTSGSGKSILSSAIYKVLKAFGAKVTIEPDPEYPFGYRAADTPDKFFEDREIMIKTKNERRSSVYGHKPKYEYRIVEKGGKYQAQYLSILKMSDVSIWKPIPYTTHGFFIPDGWSDNISDSQKIIEWHIKDSEDPVVVVTHHELFGE